MPYHFSMLLQPDKYSMEWKHLIWQMLDFINFKETLAPKHHELVEHFGVSSQQFDEARALFDEAAQKKEDLEITKHTNVRLIEEISIETTRIKEETEERGHELAKKQLELKLNTEKKQEI